MTKRHYLFILIALSFVIHACDPEEIKLPANSGTNLESTSLRYDDIIPGLITLKSRVDIPGQSGIMTDVWGFVDSAGTEYAIVGRKGATALSGTVSIFNVSDPSSPVLIKQLDGLSAFDFKAWGNYIYTVDGGENPTNGFIIDISDPANATVMPNRFPSSHNIFISENGYLISECPGLRIFDLNQDPLNPTEIFNDFSFDCHDAAVVGNRLYDFHGYDGTNIYDFTDPSNLVLLGRITDPKMIYHHNGWPTTDSNFLVITDELAFHPRADFTIWDISDLSNPVKVEGFSDSLASAHNAYIRGNYLFMSYYASGFRVFDISDPYNTILVGEFDTNSITGEGFGQSTLGAFGVYAFAPSGNIYVSDDNNGLYIFGIGE